MYNLIFQIGAQFACKYGMFFISAFNKLMGFIVK